jgi:hypothetical protein
MFQEFFSRSTLLVWPLVGLLLSVTFFIGVLAFVFLGLRDRTRVSELASMPLDAEETVVGPAGIQAGAMGRAS